MIPFCSKAVIQFDNRLEGTTASMPQLPYNR